MSYNQWIEITVVAEDLGLKVKNAKLKWGKFYQQGDKGVELEAEEISKITINRGNEVTICACGRSGAASGTEGSFELHDSSINGDAGDAKSLIGTYSWCVPWDTVSYDNISKWTQKGENESNYTTDAKLGNLTPGAIGNVYIMIQRANR